MMTEEELMKISQEKYRRMEEYDQRKKIADQKNRDHTDELVALVNSILSKHGVVDTIDASHIRFNADYIGNIGGINDKKLSELIFDTMYPRPTIKTFSHYTKFDKGTSIIANKEFWLFNLLQNFSDQEFRLFYQEHGFDGYEQERSVFGVETGYRAIMSEIFALCLTTESNHSPTLWNYFGGQGTGLKLTFEVESLIPDFRKVYYSNTAPKEAIPIMKDLSKEIQKRFGQVFNFTYVSRIGAFYISGNYENEAEYRLLLKTTADNYNTMALRPEPYQGDIKYIVLPFISEFAKFKLTKVQKGANCDLKDFEELVAIIHANHENVEIIR